MIQSSRRRRRGRAVLLSSGGAPTISATSGTGYVGSVYTAVPGDGSASGQWRSDGSPISGETALTYTMTADVEGTDLTFVQGDSQESAGIELFVPSDVASYLVDWDPLDESTLTLSGSDVSAVTDKAGTSNLEQANASLQPELTADNGLNFIEQNMAAVTEVTGVRFLAFVSLSASGSNNSTAVCPVIGEQAASGQSVFLRTNSVDYSISIDGNVGDTGAAGLDGDDPLVSGTNIDLGLSNAGYSDKRTWVVEFDASQSVKYLGRLDTGSVFRSTATYGQVLLLSAVPTKADRQKIEGYLFHRWGTEPLEAGHPYETDAPLA